MDEGKFFRGLAKVRDDGINPETIRKLLEADDRLLGYGVAEAKKRGIMARLKHWWGGDGRNSLVYKQVKKDATE